MYTDTYTDTDTDTDADTMGKDTDTPVWPIEKI